MRVLAVIGALSTGGTERQLIAMGERLPALGVDFRIATINEGGDLTSVATAAGIGVHSLELRERIARLGTSRRRSILSLLAAQLRLIWLVHRLKVDVMYAPLFWSEVLAGVAAWTKPGLTLIAGRRSMAAARRPARRSYLLLERLVKRRINLWVANCEAALDDAVSSDGIERSKAVVIYNGVAIPGDAAPFRQHPTRIVTVANLGPHKGLDTLLQAAVLVIGAAPDTTFLIAGVGPLELPLRERASHLGIAERVCFLGHVADVPTLLRSADLYLHTSSSEGFSNSILEAMAVGLPIVATAVGGTSELVGSAGILVQPDDPEPIAAALLTLMRNDVDRSRLALAARDRASSCFSMDSMILAFAAVFAS